MKKVIFLSLAVVLVGTLVLAGCGKKAAEKTTEKALEPTTNGAATVDISDKTVTINTNAGTWTAGEEVKIPDSFPGDVYIIDGTVRAATTIVEGEIYSVTIETNKSVNQAKSEYEEKLEDEGWEIGISLAITGAISLSAEKGDRMITVAISEVEETGLTMVTITTGKK